MNDHLRQLVRRHDPLHGRNVAREYLQARILAALQRAGAMTSLAFHGGTCLRFLYDLPRYSEDLNFTLEGKPANSLSGYAQVVRTALAAENYRVDVRIREHRAVDSALVRFPASCTTSAFRRTPRRCSPSRSKSTPILPRVRGRTSLWCAVTRRFDSITTTGPRC